jgi:hypothetical protein
VDVELTALSGKVFAVELMALVRPPFPPTPLMKPHRTRRKNMKMDIVWAPEEIPVLKMYSMPE